MKTQPEFDDRLKIAAVWILRVAVGVVFIYSGFVKADDLWGFIYKLEEYFSICGLSLPRSVTWTFAMLTSGFEFICGLLLLCGCYKRSVPILLTSMMAVMLPLTLYLYIADPIEDCGCFGDAIVISNGVTFLKNVVLTPALVVLIYWNHRVRQAIFKPDIQWIVATVSMVYIVVLGLVCYNVQPLIDFRPYPEGSAMFAHDEESDDEIMFIYSNGDEVRQFSADNLPSDTTWVFVRRSGGENSGSNRLGIYDDDEDVTEDVVDVDRRQFLLVIPDLLRADISNSYFINELSRLSKDCDIDFVGLLATDMVGIERWKDISLADYPCYTVEDTSLKELVRGNVSIVYVDNGIIIWKRTVSSFETSELTYLKNRFGCDFPIHMTKPLSATLIEITSVFAGFLLLLWIIQISVIAIIRKKEKKTKTKAASDK